MNLTNFTLPRLTVKTHVTEASHAAGLPVATHMRLLAALDHATVVRWGSFHGHGDDDVVCPATLAGLYVPARASTTDHERFDGASADEVTSFAISFDELIRHTYNRSSFSTPFIHIT